MAPTSSPASRLTITSIALAAALVPLSSTMIAVALPHIADDFDISRGRTGILVTVYLAAMLAGQPVAGRLSDALGARATALGALTGFSACCVLAMVPASFGVLIAARTGQAVFASALAPSVQSMLRSIVGPDDRGRAFGVLGSTIGIGAGAGPVVGGLLIAGFGWRGIFAVNLPVAALSFAVFWRLPARSVAGGARSAQAEVPGSIANRTFTLAFWNQALTTVGQYALLLLVPIILDARGWGPVSGGLVLAALTIGMVAVSPVGGRLGDERGHRSVILYGSAAAATTLAVCAGVGPELPVGLLVPLLVTFGVGLGAATPNVTALALEAVPDHRAGLAAGWLSMSRYTGSIAVSITLSLIVGDEIEGVGLMLWIAFAASLAAVLAAAALPRKQQRRSLAERRAPHGR